MNRAIWQGRFKVSRRDYEEGPLRERHGEDSVQEEERQKPEARDPQRLDSALEDVVSCYESGARFAWSYWLREGEEGRHGRGDNPLQADCSQLPQLPQAEGHQD